MDGDACMYVRINTANLRLKGKTPEIQSNNASNEITPRLEHSGRHEKEKASTCSKPNRQNLIDVAQELKRMQQMAKRARGFAGTFLK